MCTCGQSCAGCVRRCAGGRRHAVLSPVARRCSRKLAEGGRGQESFRKMRGRHLHGNAQQTSICSSGQSAGVCMRPAFQLSLRVSPIRKHMCSTAPGRTDTLSSRSDRLPAPALPSLPPTLARARAPSGSEPSAISLSDSKSRGFSSAEKGFCLLTKHFLK